MRTFYQEKLWKMTQQLREQIEEKSSLESELRKYEQDSQKYKDLQVALKVKEKHIDHLRNRQSEIESLTSIASRNESVIEKLKEEILEMKQQIIAFQKQLTQERKDHAKSMQHLKKQVLTQEKKLNKAKQDLANTLVQKQRVQHIATSHADEIHQLRSKYREAEKKLRMQTLKRGVMERAGIDPVLVGRNMKEGGQSQRTGKCIPSNSLTNTHEKRSYTSRDIHKMKSFLDDKIAEIGRKEAIADKLAAEWEDHLELSTRKEQLLNETMEKDDAFISDEIEALDFQIQYKESRIRQLARCLTSTPKGSSGNDDGNHFLQDTMIDDRQFRDMTRDFSALAAAQLASKVLFGMVVKERRRVAKLARTASSLDQKALDAEELASSKEAALRSLMEESKNERVAMAQNHQERILSLMSLLQEAGVEQANNNTNNLPTQESVILSMANERIDILEKQLEELNEEKKIRRNFQIRESETIEELTKLTEDYGQMIEKTKQLHVSLITVREKIASPSSELGDPGSLDRKYLLQFIDGALNRGQTDNVNSVGSRKSLHLPSAMKVSAFESVSEDEDEETSETSFLPEWAGNIMDDLAIIAAGEVPPSLQKQNGPRPPSSKNNSVFDRLSNPDSFTGTQRSQQHDHIIDDDITVGSMHNPRNSSVRKDTASLMRSKHGTRNLTPIRSRSRSSTPVQKRSINNTPTPFRQTVTKTPLSSKTSATKIRLPDRITEILKEGRKSSPPTELSVPRAASYGALSSGESGFMQAYTKKDVFERLQKKMTNSYTLAQMASNDED